ncbi:DUF3114 domain-containing protein, partial [Streptococcus sobrinus]
MPKIGSAAFWSGWKEVKNDKDPCRALRFVLDQLDLPQDLSGDLTENQALVAKFS